MMTRPDEGRNLAFRATHRKQRQLAAENSSRSPTMRGRDLGFTSGKSRIQPLAPIQVPPGRDIPGQAEAASSIALGPAPASH